MKRLIFAALSTIALMNLYSLPASALNERFENSREQVMNKLNPRFEQKRQEVINKLNERFEESRQEMLNK